MAKIDSVYDFTDKGLVEVKSWLEPWFRCRCAAAVADTSFPIAVGELATTRDLRGYWRLGEGASPFTDTSGYAGGPSNAVKHTTNTIAMTDSITGALPPADDDGAVQFNAFLDSHYLQANANLSPAGRFDFLTGDDEMTITAWVNPAAGTTTYPTTAVGSYLDEATYGNSGYRLGVNFPALTPFFQRRKADALHTEVIVTGLPMVAGTWYFLAGTYSSTDGHRLYVNGALAASNATTFTGLPTFGQGFWFGYGQVPGSTVNFFQGGLDEVTVWGDALTAAEVSGLMAAGVVSTLAGRTTERVLTVASPGATPTIDTDNYDVVHLIGLAAAITSMTTNLSGTPVDGDSLRISFTDNGTARAITWGASFEASTVALPTTTVVSRRLDTVFFWNTETLKWRCVTVA